MALRIVLNEKAHKRLTEHPDAQMIRLKGQGSIDGCRVCYNSDGDLFYEVNDETRPLIAIVPFALRPYVLAFDWRTCLPPDGPTKTLGRYVFQTAEAIVDHGRDKLCWRKIRVHGPKLEDVFQLYYQLRAGTAELSESWQKPEAVLDGVIEEALGIAEPPQLPAEPTSIAFRCPACAADYDIKAEKVLRRKIRTTCRKCGSAIHLDNGVVEERSGEHRLLPVKPTGGTTN